MSDADNIASITVLPSGEIRIGLKQGLSRASALHALEAMMTALAQVSGEICDAIEADIVRAALEEDRQH